MPTEKSLTFQRGLIKGSLTRFKKYIESLRDMEVVDVDVLQCRIAGVKPLLQEFNEVQAAIESENEVCDEVQRDEFERLYYEWVAQGNKLVAKQTAISSGCSSSSTSSDTKIQLPKIDLPRFNGEFDKWFPFCDTFELLINSNRDLTVIQRFHYLKSALQGEPKGLLQSLEMSAANYDVAWELLRSRYDDERSIVKSHIRALCEIPSVTKESAPGLRKIGYELRTHLQSLKALKRPVDTWDDIIIHLVSEKIDPVTIREWESSLTSRYPTVSQLIEFIERKCRTLEDIQKRKASAPASSFVPNQPRIRKAIANHATTQIPICSWCNENHYIQNCPVWLNMSVEQRFSEVKTRKLCVLCLKPNHLSSNCKASRCKICHSRHNSLLHFSNSKNDVHHEPAELTPGPGNVYTDKYVQPPADHSKAVSSNYAVQPVETSSEVILSTALVHVADANGTLHVCRALLDCGSQSNFIRKDFAALLKVPLKSTSLSVSGVGQSSSVINHIVKIRINSRYNGYNESLDCLVLDKITQNLPLVSLDRDRIKLPRGIKLADENFHSSSPIQMLIGADTFWSLLCVGQIKSSYHPLLQKTHLG